MRRAIFPVIAGTALTLAAAGNPARAVDETKPAACNGLAFVDPAGDNVNVTVPEPATGTDLIGGFVKHDPAKGDQATTFNLVVKDLDPAVPPGYVTLSWIGYYPAKDEPTRWVRAVADFSGGIAYEYGHVEDAEATGVSLYDGDIEGKMFEGADGIVQLVMPKGDAAPGVELKPVYGNILQGQASLPPQTGAPARGTSWVMDRGPDSEGEANATAAVKACPSAEPAPADPATVPTVVPAPAASSAPPPPPQGSAGPPPPPPPPPPATATPIGSRALPVGLVRASVRSRRVRGRVMRLRLRSSETVTAISAQLRRGRRVAGTGRLARLNGTGTLRIRLAKRKRGKRLQRGRYVLDLVGADASGKRLLKSYRVRVR